MFFDKKLTCFFPVLLCSLLWLRYPVAAQSTARHFAFNALTINDGLSQGMVIRILQDRFGFMWFATLDGLNRYDGYNFTVYRHNAQDTTSITKSYVQALFEDSQGRLWIGTVSGGLDLYDRERETFIHVKDRENNNAALSYGSITSISEDKHGNIWVHVVDKLEKITITSKPKATPEKFSIKPVKVPFHSAASLLSITRGGNIYYVNAKDGVVYRLDNEQKEHWSVVLKSAGHLQKPRQNTESHFRIVQLLQDKTTEKLYLFQEGHIIRYDEKSGAPEKVYPHQLFEKMGSSLLANSDMNGLVWFCYRGKTYYFDTKTGKINYAAARNPEFERPLSNAYTTFTDRSGLLWIGTSGYGLLKRSVRSENFRHTGTSSNYSIKEANDGKILFGNKVLVREVFDRTTGQLTNVSEKDADQFNKYLFLPMAADENGDWFVADNRLECYNRNLKKTVSYALPASQNNEYEDLIQCTIKDFSGNVWLGTTDGLFCFNLASRQWRVYRNKVNDSYSLNSDLIFSLCLDPVQPKKYLWVGTGSAGLNRLDMESGKFNSYTTKDGLPNNVIYGILPDDDGNLWISTNKGLSCLVQRNKSFRNFDYKDGLQSNEFNRGAYLRTKDGWLFFGGVNGFNYFHPREILSNKTVPPILITAFNIHNRPVPVQGEGSPLSKAIYLTNKITLPYNQNIVSFEFAAMDFTNPEKNIYQYQLQGFQNDWINANKSHSVTYTNLDPGTYTFTVKGTNNDGTWNEKGTSFQLTILPPWYRTWWFRTVLVLGFLLSAYTLYRYRLAQVLKLQSIRNRIAGDLHDEVGSNLSNIYIFSNVAQQKAKANGETGPLLQKITDYTQQSMEAMNDIVWMINTQNDRFENIMVRMRTLAAEFSETSNCSLHLDFDESLNDVKLNMEERKNFYLIYKEAINNAAKYAGCKALWIEMMLINNTVTLKITDNGRGFDMANANKGNGLSNMKKRAELLKANLTIVSTIGEGTNLQLSFKV